MARCRTRCCVLSPLLLLLQLPRGEAVPAVAMPPPSVSLPALRSRGEAFLAPQQARQSMPAAMSASPATGLRQLPMTGSRYVDEHVAKAELVKVLSSSDPTNIAAYYEAEVLRLPTAANGHPSVAALLDMLEVANPPSARIDVAALSGEWHLAYTDASRTDFREDTIIDLSVGWSTSKQQSTVVDSFLGGDNRVLRLHQSTSHKDFPPRLSVTDEDGDTWRDITYVSSDLLILRTSNHADGKLGPMSRQNWHSQAPVATTEVWRRAASQSYVDESAAGSKSLWGFGIPDAALRGANVGASHSPFATAEARVFGFRTMLATLLLLLLLLAAFAVVVVRSRLRRANSTAAASIESELCGRSGKFAVATLAASKADFVDAPFRSVRQRDAAPRVQLNVSQTGATRPPESSSRNLTLSNDADREGEPIGSVMVNVTGKDLLEVKFWKEDTIFDIKRVINDVTGIPPDSQSLRYNKEDVGSDEDLVVTWLRKAYGNAEEDEDNVEIYCFDTRSKKDRTIRTRAERDYEENPPDAGSTGTDVATLVTWAFAAVVLISIGTNTGDTRGSIWDVYIPTQNDMMRKVEAPDSR